MRLYKKSDGVIIDDHFTNLQTARWKATGDVSVAVRPGYVRLGHSLLGTSQILTDIPNEDFVMEVYAEYTPQVPGDVGGVIIWGSAEENTEFLESESVDKEDSYSTWKVVRKGTQYDLYAAYQGQYELINTVALNANKIGVILKNKPREDFEPLDIDRIIICRSDTLRITSLFTGYKVILRDHTEAIISEQIVARGFTGVDFLLPSLSFDGIVEIQDEEGSLLGKASTTFYGGDVYVYGSYLQVRQGEVELSRTSPTDTGVMKNHLLTVQFNIYNPHPTAEALNVKLSIQKYMSKFGFEWADLSWDNVTYNKMLELTSLPAGESEVFWLRVAQTAEPPTLEALYFQIFIDHD